MGIADENALMRFLGLIRSEAQRASAPAVLALAQDRQHRGAARRLGGLRSLAGLTWRCYRAVAALRCMPPGDLVLPGGGHKDDEMYAELTAAARDLPQGPSIARAPRMGRQFDPVALYIALRTLPLIRCAYASPRLRPFCDVLAHARAFSLALAREPAPRHWLIIGDLSPYLIALAGACKAAGHKVIYWQYSYLDFKHMPAQSDVAIILNERGRALSAPRVSKSLTARYYWRPRPAISSLRLAGIETGTLGSMLNVHADGRALRQLQAFSRALGRPIEVRLHPNSRLDAQEWPKELALAPKAESLEAFAQRHAILLCGNTQAQAKALADGTAVIHCQGLDPLPFDHHGYVRDGILLGCQTPAEPDLTAIRQFYEAGEYRVALAGHMGPEPEGRVPGLEAFVRHFRSASAQNSDSGLVSGSRDRIL